MHTVNYKHAEGEPDLDELRKIIGEIAERYGIVRVYLFGSRARGTAGPESDYDFCIIPGEETSLFDIGGFLTDCKEILGHEVDVVSENAVRPSLYNAIVRDRILLYEKSELSPNSDCNL